MGRYMDDHTAIGIEIVERGPNVTESVQQFATEQKAAPDLWDRGPEPLLCYSLVQEHSFATRSGGGDPVAVMAWRRWSKVCGRYILFAEGFDKIPSEITKSVAEGGCVT